MFVPQFSRNSYFLLYLNIASKVILIVKMVLIKSAFLQKPSSIKVISKAFLLYKNVGLTRHAPYWHIIYNQLNTFTKKKVKDLLFCKRFCFIVVYCYDGEYKPHINKLF